MTPDYSADYPEDAAGTIPPASLPRPRFRLPRPDWRDLLFYGLLAFILVAAAWLRFDAQNWDDYTHLHPDERFLTQVVEKLNGPLSFTDKQQADRDQHAARCEMRYPAAPADANDYTALLQAGQGGYFDAECSPLNPNNVGHGLYVYGQFPLFTVRLAAEARTHFSQEYHAFLETFDPDAALSHIVTTHWATYTGAQLIGRTVSALADWLTVIVIFLLGRRLYGRWTGLWAAGLYAFAGFPVQQSHFWTVDAFTTFWVTLALYLAVRALDGASAIRGPLPLAYLAVWGGGVLWETAYWQRPVLGLAVLGAIALVVLLLAGAACAWLDRRGAAWGGSLLAGSGALASGIYLIVWTILDVAAPRAFPLGDDLLALGFAGLLFGLATGITFAAAALLHRRQSRRAAPTPAYPAAGAVGVTWLALVIGLLVGGLAPWPTLLIAAGSALLLIFDFSKLTDYALFGLALGGAVASRINVAPLAGIIVVAAGIRVLPALDRALRPPQRKEIIAYAMTGMITAALLSFIVFRLLQPHAFQGPGLFGLRFNPAWREDISEAAYLTSGNWDAPPNHQWASRTPYLFPWRNIVEWGLGIPLGLVAWAAWAWAGVTIVRARANWTRHAILFAWVLVCFGWLGGRWVTTMRYFLPIYPALALLGAWGMGALLTAAWRRRHGLRRNTLRRLALAGSIGLALVTTLYTTLYGLGVHNIHRQQLTRVAASRWFQETIPGDFGLWIERADGTRKLVNLGRGWNAQPPAVFRLEQGASQTFLFNVPADARLTQLTFHRLSDPDRDPGIETLRVRVFRHDANLGQQLLYEDLLRVDFSGGTRYGAEYSLEPDTELLLPLQAEANLPANDYVLEVTALDGGPILFIHNVTEGALPVLHDISIGLQLQSDLSLTFLDLSFNPQPLIQGYGDDIPAEPTHWNVGGSDTLPFVVPADGVIRTLEIPHLGDALRDADEETVRFTLIAADGSRTSATLTGDFSSPAGSLGGPQTITFDPPLTVRRLDAQGIPQRATLVVEAEDDIYTSGPIIAWEGDWDDPIPWPTCPIPDDMIYADDLPSGLSAYTCQALNLYGAHYEGLKLWMLAEDNHDKYEAMTNALDQADYIVITSNRFYDSLTRVPMRWPMTGAYYDALFAGRLGFELFKTFESYPHIGGLELPDQILPTDDLPDVLNEQWEAEEAFHVYDHPAVLVFRKTAAYSPENTRAILNSVSRRAVATAIPGYVVDPEPVGVVPWGAKQASQAPTLLEFTEEQWDIQRKGGTWSEMFDLDALLNRSQPAAVIAWWLLVVVSGGLAWPLLFVIFPALPDRAYPAAKITAWLLVAWVAWAGGTLHLLTWTRAGLLIILLGLGLLSGVVSWRRRAELRAYIRARWRHLLAMEGLALLLFAGFLGVRLGNPDLWHGSFGGEKPMDFAYFNAVLRSTIFPPLDPWFSGGYMNYYYFGYVIVGVPVKLLGIQPSVAYNLILPTLYAMTGIGVFSVAYNWVRARAESHTPHPTPAEARQAAISPSAPLAGAGDRSETPTVREARAPGGSAWLAGLLALVLAVLLGNLGTLHVIVNNVAALDGWQSPSLLSQVRLTEIEARRPEIYQRMFDRELERYRDDHGGAEPTDPVVVAELTRNAEQATNTYIVDYAEHPPLVQLWQYNLENLRQQVGAFFGGLGQVMDGTPLQMHTHRWYWAPTRIIGELPDGAGHNAIAEMPYFTFLYGDLHAHMIAMPVTLLALLWLLAEIIGAGRGLRTRWEAGLALALGGLTVGVLRPTNSWDWVTYMILGAAGLTYAAWLGAVRQNGDRPPSHVAAQLWDWLRPGRAQQLWPVLLLIPAGAGARVAFYFFRKMQADEQARRALRAGETLIEPSLTASGVILWSLLALALAVFAYVALVIALRAYLDRRRLVDWLGRLALFAAFSVLAALPFTLYFATGYNSIKPWGEALCTPRCSLEHRTPLWAYLYIHGTFIFIVLSFLAWQTGRWLRRTPVRALEGLAVPVIGTVLALAGTLIASIVIGVREVPVAQVAVPLIAWATLLFFLPRQAPLLRALYALIVLALAISLGVEVIVLDGDIGRQNTVFKFYIQVWLLLSVVGGVVLAWMLHSAERWRGLTRGLWQSALAVLFTIGLLYPVLATQARFLDRFNAEKTPLTLDGMEFMNTALHGEHGVWFKLDSEYRLIRWMQQNVKGTPVVMEAHLYPPLYHWSGRISIYTGLPTILGWDWHQRQQRSLPQMDMLVQNRQNNTAAFYTLSGSEGIQAALDLIDEYDIEYIVLAVLERAFYDDLVLDTTTGHLTPGHAPGLEKFDKMVELNMLRVVYEAPVCLDTAIEKLDDCPPESLTVDRVYRVVAQGGALADTAVGQ